MIDPNICEKAFILSKITLGTISFCIISKNFLHIGLTSNSKIIIGSKIDINDGAIKRNVIYGDYMDGGSEWIVQSPNNIPIPNAILTGPDQGLLYKFSNNLENSVDFYTLKKFFETTTRLLWSENCLKKCFLKCKNQSVHPIVFGYFFSF